MHSKGFLNKKQNKIIAEKKGNLFFRAHKQQVIFALHFY